jgi:para-nitrobenzyl esterase
MAGTVRGWTDGTVAAFLGIPYGQPTTGVDRFKPPTAAGPWRGLRDALRFGPDCPQVLEPNDYAWNCYVGTRSTSEDCLTLNVWTPQPRRNGDLPVLLWIHGGEFASGGSAYLPTDGASLARRGEVVIVSITHRLNVFGYLFLGGVAGKDYQESGNVGQLDIVLALEWVRDNIEAFGGDPQNVTIFGQSGGAAKIGCLMAMPGAKGLFQRAVMQSGVRMAGPSLAQADAYTRRLLKCLAVGEADWARLLKLPPERLLWAYVELKRSAPPRPVLPRDWATSTTFEPGPAVDGSSLPIAPISAVVVGSASKVSLMIGTCADEMDIFLLNLPALPAGRSLLSDVRMLLGDHGPRLVESYVDAMSATSEDRVAKQLMTDWIFRIPSIRFAEAQLAAGQRDVFMYEFAWQSAAAPEVGASHSLVVPFFFGTTAMVPATAGDASSAPLAMQMSNALLTFAKTGRPDRVSWPAYDVNRRVTMVFDRDSRTVDDPRASLRVAWDGYPDERLGV